MPNTTNAHIPTVVYVEDNAGDAALLEEALRERGHRVQLLVIETGDRALHYFQIKASARDVPPPHCILLDHHLQTITGGQLLRFIRSCDLFRDTPVYIFSAMSGYRELITEGIVSEKSFLAKPHDWAGFLELATLMMQSAATTKQSDSSPEMRAPQELRRPQGERMG